MIKVTVNSQGILLLMYCIWYWNCKGRPARVAHTHTHSLTHEPVRLLRFTFSGRRRFPWRHVADNRGHLFAGSKGKELMNRFLQSYKQRHNRGGERRLRGLDIQQWTSLSELSAQMHSYCPRRPALHMYVWRSEFFLYIIQSPSHSSHSPPSPHLFLFLHVYEYVCVSVCGAIFYILTVKKICTPSSRFCVFQSAKQWQGLGGSFAI